LRSAHPGDPVLRSPTAPLPRNDPNPARSPPNAGEYLNRARAHPPIPGNDVLARTTPLPGRDDSDCSRGAANACSDLSAIRGRGVACKGKRGQAEQECCRRQSSDRSSSQQLPVPEQRRGALRTDPESGLSIGRAAFLLLCQTSGRQTSVVNNACFAVLEGLNGVQRPERIGGFPAS
jgi:hypothetical protein